MRPRFRLNLPPRFLAWLLVLLLPLAQAVAAGHAVSHLAGGQDASDEQQALHAAHCELCITAATVAGGALPAALPSLPPLDAAQAMPAAVLTQPWLPTPAPVYDSRAPPAFTH
ncbi:hypothetical protein [uncultured Azohydromonas sp.]|jgi:hypothetical protein|uniref:hypothetical protein n=1 Tax=uncultured Azohydromonas sp. TaxID=487342 RepID=UPI002614DC4C|nr:hypothetical protein [uncultured Azohydromonas sp.]